MRPQGPLHSETLLISDFDPQLYDRIMDLFNPPYQKSLVPTSQGIITEDIRGLRFTSQQNRTK